MKSLEKLKKAAICFICEKDYHSPIEEFKNKNQMTINLEN
jgi:hypothetical protein